MGVNLGITGHIRDSASSNYWQEQEKWTSGNEVSFFAWSYPFILFSNKGNFKLKGKFKLKNRRSLEIKVMIEKNIEKD